MEVFGNIITPRIHSLNKIYYALTVPPPDSSASLLYGWCFLIQHPTTNPPNLQKFNDAFFTSCMTSNCLGSIWWMFHTGKTMCVPKTVLSYNSSLLSNWLVLFAKWVSFPPYPPSPLQEVFIHNIFPPTISNSQSRKSNAFLEWESHFCIMFWTEGKLVLSNIKIKNGAFITIVQHNDAAMAGFWDRDKFSFNAKIRFFWESCLRMVSIGPVNASVTFCQSLRCIARTMRI